jgi:pimeloyl-ACP methyl ester carboxylesterase
MIKEFFLPSRGIYYRINEFQDDRPTLVFIHGLSGSSSAWLEYEKEFEKKYNLVFFDLRGHGKSLRFPKYKDYEIANFADDLCELISRLKIEKFVLISHSFGALVALEFLTKHQDKVMAAVFLSPSFSVKNRKAALVIRPLLAAAKLFDLIPYSSKAGGHVDYSKYKNTGDWNIRRTIADSFNTGLRSYLFSARQTYKVDYENFLEKIKMPVLLVHGKKDTIFPAENSIIMSQKIKNSKIIFLDKADHIVVLNNFSEVSEIIDDFIRGNMV